MVSTMKIGEETKKSHLKIGAEHTMRDGKERSLEDVVKISSSYIQNPTFSTDIVTHPFRPIYQSEV